MKTGIIISFLTLLAVGCSDIEYVQERGMRSSSESGRESRTVFVATDRHDVGQGNNLKALVQLVSQDMSGDAPDFYFIGGDNVGKGSMSDSLASPPYHISEVYSEILAGDGRKEVNFLTTYGSHDNGCLDSYYDFFSGPRACDGYYLYGISYAQMIFAADSSAATYTGMDRVDSFGLSAETGSRSFLRWASSLQDNAPIIVMSHVPIHANRSDNPGGAIWASALNKVSSKHDIFLLFGHNHTTEERRLASQTQQADTLQHQQDTLRGQLDSLQHQMDTLLGQIDSLQHQMDSVNVSPVVNDQDYYMVLPGSKLPVQTSDKSVTDTITIRFVYMNAGYLKLGYASTIKLMDQNRDGDFDTYCVTRHTVADTVIAKFGNTSIPNPVYLH